MGGYAKVMRVKTPITPYMIPLCACSAKSLNFPDYFFILTAPLSLNVIFYFGLGPSSTGEWVTRYKVTLIQDHSEQNCMQMSVTIVFERQTHLGENPQA